MMSSITMQAPWGWGWGGLLPLLICQSPLTEEHTSVVGGKRVTRLRINGLSHPSALGALLKESHVDIFHQHCLKPNFSWCCLNCVQSLILDSLPLKLVALICDGGRLQLCNVVQKNVVWSIGSPWAARLQFYFHHWWLVLPVYIGKVNQIYPNLCCVFIN